ncbi:MAG: hypothetical protein ACE5NW_08815 [Acidiferrobacterales bacterium]
MVTLGSLWLAILLAAVVVWIASALIWMVLPHHKSDYKGLPDEEAARKALTPQDLAPGQYNIPHCASMEEMKKPEVQKKFEEGPAGFITILPRGVPAMGKPMVLTFVYYLIVGVIIAYVASRTLAPGADYLAVFRVTSTIAWLAYGAAIIPDAVWFGRPWSAVGKHLIDALVYALLTAGVFGWLWPS